MSEEVVADDEAEGAETAEPVVEVARLYGVPVTEFRDMTVLHPSADELVATAQALKDDTFVMCLDVTAVDYLEQPRRGDLPAGVEPQRFETVYTFISHQRAERIRIRVQVPAPEGDESPTVPSLFDLYPGTEYTEREAFDMFGVVFDGHPDLTRILMPEDWNGHPLRKDFAVGNIPVQFKDAPSRR